MTNDILLSEESFQVLKRMSADWSDERAAVAAIADAMHVHTPTVRACIKHLLHRHLVERRTVHAIRPFFEIRKVGR